MIPFGPLRADGPALQDGVVTANNVVPKQGSYGALRSSVAYTNALPGICRGAYSASGISVRTFAGTDTTLYLLNGKNWQIVGGPYPRALDSRWAFNQFGDLLIATNGSIAPQKWNLSSGSVFSSLGGNPPAGRHIANVRDFLVLGNMPGLPTTVRWSGIDSAESWNISQDTQADVQTLPDGGEVMGLVGGEYGVILQSNAIRRMSYVGTPIVFQIDKIEENRGVFVPGSVASFGSSMIFYLSNDGFYATDGSGPSTSIGSQKIDKTFFKELDQLALDQISATIDAINRLYIVSYPAKGSGGIANRLAIFNIETAEWSFADLPAQTLFRSHGASTSLEDLVALGHTNIDAMTVGLDSRIWQGGAISLGLLDTQGCAANLSGPTLPAIIETADIELTPMARTEVTGCHVYCNGGTPSIALGVKERAIDPVTYSSERSINQRGVASLRAGGRFHRVRITMPAGGDWSDIQGFDLERVYGGGR